jgi:NADP-dependent 3-hydroxy acid dehydrogenase YdfG
MPTTASWRQAIVVGASSGIGAAVARRSPPRAPRWRSSRAAGRARGGRARDQRSHRRPARALVFPHDVTAGARGAELLAAHLPRARRARPLVYAAGVMPRIGADEYDLDKDRAIIDVNVVGAMAWINPVAERFARAGGGTIVGISSVAGDRGRRGNPAYHASKAALDTYLEAVRNRVARHGVRVVTAKPGRSTRR